MHKSILNALARTGSQSAAMLVESAPDASTEIERLRAERDALVATLRGVLQVYALQAARDRADPKMLEGWRKLQAEIQAVIDRTTKENSGAI